MQLLCQGDGFLIISIIIFFVFSTVLFLFVQGMKFLFLGMYLQITELWIKQSDIQMNNCKVCGYLSGKEKCDACTYSDKEGFTE